MLSGITQHSSVRARCRSVQMMWRGIYGRDTAALEVRQSLEQSLPTRHHDLPTLGRQAYGPAMPLPPIDPMAHTLGTVITRADDSMPDDDILASNPRPRHYEGRTSLASEAASLPSSPTQLHQTTPNSTEFGTSRGFIPYDSVYRHSNPSKRVLTGTHSNGPASARPLRTLLLVPTGLNGSKVRQGL
jgi:hypothetical protein